jgi:hypothetical protein
LRHESMSMPSRLVSMRGLSIARFPTPVARTPKCPPFHPGLVSGGHTRN